MGEETDEMRQTYKLNLSCNMHGWQPHIPPQSPLSARSKMYLLLKPQARSRRVHSPVELKMSVCWVLNDHISFIFAQPANPPRSQKRNDAQTDTGTLVQPLASHCFYKLKVSTQLSGPYAISGTASCLSAQQLSAQTRAALVAEDG